MAVNGESRKMLNNNEVINKLQNLADLLDKKSHLEYRIKYGELRKAKERMNEIRRIRGDGPKVPSVYTTIPIYPISKDVYLPSKLNYEKIKKLLIPFASVGILAIILFLITNVTFFSSIAAVGIVGTAVLLYFSKKLKEI